MILNYPFLNMENLDGIISLLIACLEFVFLINLLVFAQKNSVNKKIIILVLLLFLYQMMEFLICYAGMNSAFVIYSVYVVISFLPPLGLIIVLNYYNKQHRLLKLLYLPPLFFAFYYPLVLSKFEIAKCTVLYASYNYPLGFLYGLFYYIPVLLTILFLFRQQFSMRGSGRRPLGTVLLAGYLIAFVPNMLFYFIIPGFTDIIESIMCKFALLLAIAYTFFALKNKQDQEGNGP